MSRFILDNKSFLCAVDSANRSLKFRNWGLEMTQNKDFPYRWIIWNVVDGYWTNVIEKVGESILEKDGFHVYIDDDLEDELRYLCKSDENLMREGLTNYLKEMNNALINKKNTKGRIILPKSSMRKS